MHLKDFLFSIGLFLYIFRLDMLLFSLICFLGVSLQTEIEQVVLIEAIHPPEFKNISIYLKFDK